MFHIIMVCTGNICRSPMAAGLLTHLLPADLKKRVRISSAGCSALHGRSAEPFAVQATAQLGIDISAHRAHQIDSDMVRSADLILTMEIAQCTMVRRLLLLNKSKIRLLTDFDPHPADPEIDDPYGAPLEAYQACIRIMRPCIEGLVEWLQKEAHKR